MGQKKSRYATGPGLDETVLRRITSATLFLPDEIQYFYYDFHKYTPTGYLTIADFEKFYRSLFHRGTPENFSRYVFNAYDTNRDGVVDFEEFITGLYYTTKASPIQKIRWAFDLCDQGNCTKNYSSFIASRHRL
jgi:Ca2+-binding EF-hand superfamily protein